MLKYTSGILVDVAKCSRLVLKHLQGFSQDPEVNSSVEQNKQTQLIG